jgi:hypothetical protein
MTPYLIAWEADENDTERDDLCPLCFTYVQRGWTCGDCWGGTDRDFYARGGTGDLAVERLEMAWRQKAATR